MRLIAISIILTLLVACSDTVDSSGTAIAKAQELCQNFGGIQNIYTKRPHSRESTRTSVVTCTNGLIITFTITPN